VSAEELAQQACEIEIETLRKPIGKQDQYLAAYGGFRHVRFNSDETVEVNPIICPADVTKDLLSRLMLFYTGIQRSADTVLSQARKRIQSNGHVRHSVERMVAMSDELRCRLLRGEAHRIGPMLAEAWELKKKMGSRVTNGALDGYYRRACRAGGEGGKVLGAGGGGCLLMAVPKRAQPSVRRAMCAVGLTEVPFRLEPEGSKIIYVGG
jgi:D-glycero-alpha-D-manno-heptose-7-phosphate kinase